MFHALFALILLGALLAARPAAACAVAPPPGQEVSIAHEDALIAWDPGSGLEHFIRRARFESTAKDFGFLVPTPSQPELAEAPEELFGRLATAIAPEQKVLTGFKSEVELASLLFMTLGVKRLGPPDGALATVGTPRSVVVLEEKTVGGLDAAVLEATNTAALLEWLDKNGYPHAPELDGWLAPYVEAGWKITAFKIARATPGEQGRTLEPAAMSSTVVRMSFSTPKPFYPYREPEHLRARVGGERSLRLWLVGPARMDGVLGEEGQPWVGGLKYAAPRSDLEALLAEAVPREKLPREGWLTAYVDSSSPRKGTHEVFFQPAKDSTPVLPHPVIVDERSAIPIPVELLFLVGIGTAVVAVKRKRSA